MSVEFETPAARVIEQFSGKKESEFRIPADLPDIAFLRRLSIQGRMRYFQGADTSAGDIITVTPTQGETFFILHATMSSTNATARAQVINDGNVRADVLFLGNSNYNFQIGIDSLVGNGVKTITLTSLTAGTYRGNLVGWVENTSRIRDVTI